MVGILLSRRLCHFPQISKTMAFLLSQIFHRSVRATAHPPSPMYSPTSLSGYTDSRVLLKRRMPCCGVTTYPHVILRPKPFLGQTMKFRWGFSPTRWKFQEKKSRKQCHIKKNGRVEQDENISMYPFQSQAISFSGEMVLLASLLQFNL
jgi:hypothetical protein